MSNEISFGPFVFNVASGELYCNGEVVRLHPKEREVLDILSRHRPNLVPREVIMDELWPGTGSETALSQTIYRLRNVLARFDTRPFIETIPTKGYRLSAQSLIRPSALRQDAMRPVFRDFQTAVVLHERRTEQSLRKAIEILEATCSKEPSYLPAQEVLASSYLNAGTRDLYPANEAYWRARQALQRALARDSAREKSFSLLSTLFLYFNCDRDAARAAAEHALLLAPQSPSAHNAAAWERLSAADFDAALTHADLSLASNPASTFSTALFGTILYMAGRYGDAHAVFEAVRTLDPQQHFAIFYDACAYAAEGDYARSEALLEDLEGNDSRSKVIALRGFIAAKRGDALSATAAINALRTLRPIPHIPIALVELSLQNYLAAASVVAGGLRAREPGLFLVGIDPLYEPLRERFPSMTERSARNEPRCDRCGEIVKLRKLSELYQCHVCWSCRQHVTDEL